jgi:GTPase SAR1 family protein
MYRVSIIGDRKTGKTNLINWLLEGQESKTKDVCVGDFKLQYDYNKVDGSLHTFQSAKEPSKQYLESRENAIPRKYRGNNRLVIKERVGFSKRYRATVSPLFYQANVGEDTIQVWDSSGVKEFSRLGLVFEEYRKVDIFLIAFSIADKSTFESIKKWNRDIVQQLAHMGAGHRVPIILVGTKLDKEESREVSQSRVQDYCRKQRGEDIPFFEVSARVPEEGASIHQVFEEAIELVKKTRAGREGGTRAPAKPSTDVPTLPMPSFYKEKDTRKAGSRADTSGCKTPDCAVQ